MQLQLFHIIGIVAFFLTGMLAFFFFSSKKHSVLTNRLLAALLLTFAVLIGYSFTHSYGIGGYFIRKHRLIFIIGQVGFLIGPLFYFYMRSLMMTKFRLKPKHLTHAIPFLIGIIYFSVMLRTVDEYNPWGSPLKFQFGLLLLLQILVYVIWTGVSLQRQGIILKQLLNRTGDPRMNWLRLLLIGFIIIWLVKLQSFVLLDVWHRWGFCPYAESLYFLTMFLLMNAFIFIGLRTSILFAGFRKYESSELDEFKIRSYTTRLLDYMKSEKPYLDANLTLTSLADLINIPMRQLSQVINQAMGKNFTDFINAYRIEECIQHLTDNQNGKRTILEIAYDVGFNSKSTFNAAFKKHTGQTPKSYKINYFHKEQSAV